MYLFLGVFSCKPRNECKLSGVFMLCMHLVGNFNIVCRIQEFTKIMNLFGKGKVLKIEKFTS